MVKIKSFLITAWLVVCCFITAFAQPPTFNFTTPTTTINIGDTVKADMIVSDFINMSGYQFSTNWDETVLEFIDIVDLNLAGLALPPSPNSFNTAPTLVGTGRMPCLWSEPGGSEATLMDGTRIFSVRFKAIATGDAMLTPGNNPTNGVTIFRDGMGVLVEGTPTFVATNLTVVNPNQGGNTVCDTITGLGIVASNDTITTGDPVCFEVKACGFMDLVGLSYTMEFNENILTFDSVTNFNLEQLDFGSFGTTNAGTGMITFAWIDSTGSGVTIPDETVLYDICFTTIGAGGSVDSLTFTSTLTDLMAEDPAGDPVDITPVPGIVVVSGTSGAAVTVDAGEGTGANGDQVCLNVYVQDFVDMLSMQYTMEWDETIIDFDTILDPNNNFMGSVGTSFNTSSTLVDNGNLTMLWTSPGDGTTPVTLSDSTIFYQICYNVVGSVGEASPITFNGDLTTMNAFQSDGMGSEIEVPVAPISGSIDVIGSGIFNLNLGDSTVCLGDTMCMPILLSGANDLLSMQFSLNWDPAIINYAGTQNNVLPAQTSIGESDVNIGQFTMQWFDFNFIQPSYPDNFAAIEICFEGVGAAGTNSTINITDIPTEIEVADHATGMPLPYTVNPGSLAIGTTGCSLTPAPIISNDVITNVLCFGDSTGVIDITVTSGTPAFGYSWTGPGGFTSMDEDLMNVPAGTYNVTVTDANMQTVTGSFTVMQPATDFTVSGTSTDAQCGTSDGTINLTIVGGQANYSFVWDNAAATGQNPTGLSAGMYCVTVTDMNSCTAETCVTVNNPSGPAIMGTKTDETCADADNGTISLTITGGMPTYSFVWDNAAATGQNPTDLPDGIYNVTVSDMNNCSASASFTINPGATVVVNSTQVNTSCGLANGSIDLTITGGTDPNVFMWDNAAATGEDPSMLPAGTYNVTVTDMNTCTATAGFTIAPSTGLTIASTQVDETCGLSNGSIDLTITGGTDPYIFMWDNAAATGEDPSMLPAGTYNVTVTDQNNCTATSGFTINPGTGLNITSTQVNETCELGNGSIDLTITGGTNPYTFMWDNAAATGEDPTGLAAGMYCVTVTDMNNCSSNDCFTLTGTTAVSATGVVTDAACSGVANGSIALTVTGGAGANTFAWDDASATGQNPMNLLAGTYTVTITNANSCTFTDSYTIGNIGTLIIGGNATDVSCNGEDDGAISVTISGGTATYSFAWDNASATGQNPTSLPPATYGVTVTDMNGCSIANSYVVDEPSAFTASAIGTNVSCNGFNDGSISVTTTGGEAPFSFAWNNASATGQNPSSLGPNTYVVTVTDNNMCEATASAIITEPSAIIIMGDVTDEMVMDDGAIDLTVTGGAGGYMYSWDNGLPAQEDQTDLPPNTYTVTVTDLSNCTAQATFAVNSLNAPAISFNAVNATCNGGSNGSITLTVTGGTPLYTYDWDYIPGPGPDPQNVGGLTAGTYTVTVTDAANVAAIEVITIGEPSIIVINVDDLSPVTCQNANDGAALVSATGGTGPITFNWGAAIGTTNNPTSLAPGDYTVTATDANMCTVTETISFTNPSQIALAIDEVIDLDCNNVPIGAISVTPSGGTAPYSSFVWTNTDVNATIGFSEDITGLLGGNYALTFQDANNCSFTSQIITVSEPAPLLFNVLVDDLDCNGDADGAINLQINGGAGGYEYSWDFNGEITQDLSGLSGGLYNVTVTDANDCVLEIGPLPVNEPNALNLAFNVTNSGIANNDGQIDLLVTGGTPVPAYSYFWLLGPTQNTSMNEDLFGLEAGSYFVTVTDGNNCEISDTVTVAGLILSSGIVEHVSCAGEDDGSIDLNVQGGIQPLEFSWTGPGTFTGITEDISELAAGTYMVTITDQNGGSSTNTFTVSEPSALTDTNISIIDESGAGCNGSIDITIEGGTGAYTYQWSNGEFSEDVTDLCKGTYSVTVLDANSCMLILSGLTVDPAPLTLSMSGVNDVTCNAGDDGEACATIFGGCGPYTFALDNNDQQVSLDGQDICFEDLVAGMYVLTITDNGTPAQTITETFEIEEPDPIALSVFSINGANDNCNGSINLNDPTGGTPIYTYQWSHGPVSQDVFNLCPEGSPYSVTVTDANNCIQVLGGLIIDDLPSELSISFDSEDEACLDACDGSIDLTIEGGTTPYTYNWADGAATEDRANLCAGSYSVTVTDANGTEISSNGISIEAPPSLLEIISADITDPIGSASNGQINLTVAGGWSGYTYSWSGPNGFVSNSMDIIGLSAGQYSVIVTDANGCQVQGSWTLQGMVLQVAPQIIEPSCFGDSDGSVALSITGGATPYVFNWSDGQTGSTAAFLTAGTYSVTVQDATGLDAIREFTLDEPNALIVEAISPEAGRVEAGVSGGTPGYNFQWNTTNGDDTQVVENLSAGEYAVLVTDAKNCRATAMVEVIGEDPECTQIRSIISPNGDGLNEEFIIGCADNFRDNNLEIYNRWGQLVWQGTNYSNNWVGTKFDGTSLPDGGYFYVFEYRDGADELKQIKGAITIVTFK